MKAKRTAAIILILVILVFENSAIEVPASAAGINNQVISGAPTAGSSSLQTGSSGLWYSVNGYPSRDDIEAIGDAERIVCPKTYLSQYLTRYIYSGGLNSVYVYRNAGKTSDSPERLDDGAKVYVIAEEGTSSCIIYKTYQNVARSGWVSTSFLSKTYKEQQVTIGSAYGGQSQSIGDVEIILPGEYMVGTECEYALLSNPVSNCVGFTLEYKVRNSTNNKDTTGKRDIYINDGTGWIWIGSFEYRHPKSYHVNVRLSSPTTVYAVAAPETYVKDVNFHTRQNILDVLVSSGGY